LTGWIEQCITSLLNMKTANVRQLRHAFGSVMEWVAEGQQVEIVKKGKVVALLSPPAPATKPKKFKLPDFAARRGRIFGHSKGPLPRSIVAEERESYEW
jgi:antitoxin (DNA-binding transcriptional repressor) of toxin-antitoxin stability system